MKRISFFLVLISFLLIQTSVFARSTASPSTAGGSTTSPILGNPVNLSNPNNTGTLPVENGGTGISALGTSLYCLRVNSAGTALEYGVCGSGGSMTYPSGSGIAVVDSGASWGTTITIGTSTTTYLRNDGSWGTPVASIGGAVTGGTAGSIYFGGTSGALAQDNANFFWDNSNKHLGIGTTTPAATLDVAGTGALKAPVGTSGQRPGTPADGMIRYNTTTNAFEGYGNSAWGSFAGGGSSLTVQDGTTTVTGVTTINLSNGLQASGTTSTVDISPVNKITALGTTTPYTVLAEDMGTTITHNKATLVSVTLPEAGSTGFDNGSAYTELNLGSGDVVITSNINGLASITIPQYAAAFPISDGANWNALVFGGVVRVGSTGQLPVYDSDSNIVGPMGGISVSTGSLTLRSVVLNGATSGAVTVSSPAVAGTTTFTLPATNGTNGWVLTTDGSGNTSWAAATGAGSGTVTASPQYQIPVYSSSGTSDIVTGSASIITNSAGDLLSVGTSTTQLAVGPNGATNPVLRVDASTSGQATGLIITGGASGNSVDLAVSNGQKMSFSPDSGYGTIYFNSSVIYANSYAYGTTLSMKDINLHPDKYTYGTDSHFKVSGAADTGLTASTSAPVAFFDMAQTRTHETGNVDIQPDFKITGSTDAYAGASTQTDGGTLVVYNKSCGTNATCTNLYNILIPTGTAAGTPTNTYSLGVEAQSGGTNNYSAVFLGGNVGIGTTAPAYTLDVTGSMRTTQAVLNSSGVPTISTCGTSPPVATAGSSNNGGQFTFGTDTPTACTVTFANAFPNYAYCTVTPASNYTGTYYISAQSKTAFTLTTGTGVNSAVFNYSCFGN